MKGSGGGYSGGYGPMKDDRRESDYLPGASSTGPTTPPPSMKPLWIGLGAFAAIAAIVGLIVTLAR